jgi:hypothetical protein
MVEGYHPQAENGALSQDAWRERGVGWLDVLLIVAISLLISLLAGSAIGLLDPGLHPSPESCSYSP